jgi:hypothetical protein
LENNEHLFKSFAPRSEWEPDLLEDITATYLLQVQSLMETVKQMDSALQRRSKIRNTSGAMLIDSDKISLQVFLDVTSYGHELNLIGFDCCKSKSYTNLLEEVAEASKLIP